MHKRILKALAALVLVVASAAGRASVGRTSLDEQAAGACADASCFSVVSE